MCILGPYKRIRSCTCIRQVRRTQIEILRGASAAPSFTPDTSHISHATDAIPKQTTIVTKPALCRNTSAAPDELLGIFDHTHQFETRESHSHIPARFRVVLSIPVGRISSNQRLHIKALYQQVRPIEDSAIITGSTRSIASAEAKFVQPRRHLTIF